MLGITRFMYFLHRWLAGTLTNNLVFIYTSENFWPQFFNDSLAPFFSLFISWLSETHKYLKSDSKNEQKIKTFFINY